MFNRQINPRGKILVVGGGPTTFLSIIRSFGRKGFSVHIANDSTTDLALYSRSLKKFIAFHPLPLPQPFKENRIS
jgi:hypothetical protein